MSSLRGKVVLITGASSGIGAGTAVEFAGLGSKLALCGRNVLNLENTAKECKEAGLSDDQILIITGDLTIDEEAKAAVDKAVKHFGQLDVLVNNAGTLVRGGVEELDMEGFDKQMNINCRTPYHMSHLSSPHIIKTKGAIVNVSSVNGMRSFPGIIGYCMAKSAVDHMTRCAALDLAKHGVRVNCVNPGVIVTNIHTRAGVTQENYQKFLEHSKTTHALGRTGTVDEVAKCITFLASSDSSFITGATIPIDGGRHAMCPR